MIGNILKVIIALILGCLFGLISGAISGALLGAIPGLFFREIILLKQTILMSISLGVILGGLFGLFATKLVDRFLDVKSKPFIGVIFGLLVGIIVIIRTGIIGNSDVDASDKYMYLIPIFYSEIVGSQIGAIIFSIIGAAGVVRFIVEDHNTVKNNKQKLEEIKRSLGMNSSEEKRG